MAEQKTKPTTVSVESFLEKVPGEGVRDDCYELVKLMQKITGAKPKMWGPAIVGFGTYHYKYDSGHEGDACIAGFSPRKQNLTVYVLPDFTDRPDLVKNLGKFKAGKCCLYFKRLNDLDRPALEKLIRYSVDYVKDRYPIHSI